MSLYGTNIGRHDSFRLVLMLAAVKLLASAGLRYALPSLAIESPAHPATSLAWLPQPSSHELSLGQTMPVPRRKIPRAPALFRNSSTAGRRKQ